MEPERSLSRSHRSLNVEDVKESKVQHAM